MGKYQIDDILNIDALVSAVIESDDFVEAVAASRENDIQGMVEEAIDEYDFSNKIRDEVVDYSSDITDLQNEIEDLKEALRVRDLNYDGFIREIEEFKKTVGKRLMEIDHENVTNTNFRTLIADLIRGSRILKWLFKFYM
jgi:hypothetical protein